MVRAVGHGAWLELRKRAANLTRAKVAALSPILVIAPHQDDETLGCGGLLSVASGLGLRPRVAFLTNGSASHTGSPTWSAERLAATRRAEAFEALAVLGVPGKDVRFLGWTDARPHGVGDLAYGATLHDLAEWASSFSPHSLWAPWAGEPHCDHAAAADLTEALAGRLSPAPTRMDYLVWGWTDTTLARSPERAWALDCPRTRGARRRALACHRTQMTHLIDDAEASFLIPPQLAALTDRPTEIFLERT